MTETISTQTTIATGGQVHQRSHLIARVLLLISFFVFVPTVALTLGRFISYRPFFILLGIIFAFGLLYYFVIPPRLIPRFGYLVGDFIFYLLITLVVWQVKGFAGFILLFFYMLLFGIINALSYNWRDIIITIAGTSAFTVAHNFYSFYPSTSFTFLETAGLTFVEVLVLTILTLESRTLADEALAVQKKADALLSELNRVQELDRLKTEFIGVASHQLRTPLSGIKWALAGIRETAHNLGAEQQNIIHLAEENIDRMIRIVSGMLDVVKVEEQTLAQHTEAVDVKKILEDVAHDYTLLAKEKDIVLETAISSPLSATANPFSLKQAIGNVLDNAIRYSPRGTRIRITGESASGKITVAITDQGIGMSEEEAAKAFSKLFRSPEAIKMSPDGSGLGLYYTKRIIEAHGGTVSIQSAPRKGTTVTITLSRQ